MCYRQFLLPASVFHDLLISYVKKSKNKKYINYVIMSVSHHHRKDNSDNYLNSPAFLKNREGHKSKLRRICPNCKIIPIDPHKKGPIYAILKSIKAFDPYSPTIVNYCDFNCLWNFQRFKEHIQKSSCDGCVVTYSGFHPHMLGNTNYAYLKVEEDKIIDIQEKKPYTSNPMNEYASSGTYFFKSSNLME